LMRVIDALPRDHLVDECAECPFRSSITGWLLYCATVLAAIDYRWWVFIHLAGVFGFLLAHGASVSALFRLRKERDREKIRQLIQFSGSTIRLFYISLLVLMLSGVIAGLQGHWFSQQWIWEAIGVLVGISVAMVVI